MRRGAKVCGTGSLLPQAHLLLTNPRQQPACPICASSLCNVYQRHHANARGIDSVDEARAIPTRASPPVASDGAAPRPITVAAPPAVPRLPVTTVTLRERDGSRARPGAALARHELAASEFLQPLRSAEGATSRSRRGPIYVAVNPSENCGGGGDYRGHSPGQSKPTVSILEE